MALQSLYVTVNFKQFPIMIIMLIKYKMNFAVNLHVPKFAVLLCFLPSIENKTEHETLCFPYSACHGL